MNIHLRGGKTAPRLHHDLYAYDPRKPPPTGFNVLTDIPYHDEEQKTPPPPSFGKGSCQHKWSMKANQSSLPEDGCPRDATSLCILAAYCTECRSHLEVSIDFSEGRPFFMGCPSVDMPLHHFLHMPDLSKARQPGSVHPIVDQGFAWTDVQEFRCSAPQCSAKLIISFSPARLTSEWVAQLIDPYMIRTRAEAAIASDPERFEGHSVPLPIQVLEMTQKYITNALNHHGPKKNIQAQNKRWMLNLGDPCADMLEYIGFSREGEEWLPPQPEPSAQIPFTNPINIRLDDIQKEIRALMSKTSEVERRSIKYQPTTDWASTSRDLKSLLGCLEYKQTPRSRRNDQASDTQEHPYYAGLGAIENFHDDLIKFAYERQVLIDADNTPYYLECLQGIAAGRNSEELATQVAIEASDEKLSYRDIRAAYKELGLDAQAQYEDDIILGTFRSRIADAPKQEAEMRRALKVIGQDRGSQAIQSVASQTVTNYEQALAFLGADKSTSDDFISSMFSVKINERSEDELTGRHALSLIASYRNSKALRNYLETGTLGEVEMDVSTAFALLDIHDQALDDEMVLTTYDVRVSDDPSQLESLKTALTAIAKARNSHRLLDFLNTGMISSEHARLDWPVGLENIGNTCYLNSLLQFYFTIRPLRDLIINIDQFKMPLDEDSLKTKRVGSRIVSKKEVTRAQQFVEELRKLFQDMINSSKASVAPEPELARLTLVSSSKEEHIRRQSMLSPTRPSLGEIQGEPVYGPLGPPIEAVQNDSEMSVDAGDVVEEKPTNDDHNRDSDNSSDVTLVDGPPPAPDHDIMILDENEKSTQQKAFEDKENIPPQKATFREPSPEVELVPLGESSPSRINEQPIPSSSGDEAGKEMPDSRSDDQGSPQTVLGTSEDKMTSVAAAPPNRPPPYPPRPKSMNTNAVQEAEYGAQQDVTEVIANVLFQLQCAIKADTVDESGEQIDQVKDLFFGKQKSYTRNKAGVIRTKEEYMSDIKVDVASGSRDIYAALDGACDVQDVEVGGDVEPQYTSISRLPPVLQVHVQRVQFDPVKKSSFKSNNHLELKETIYMDRYMESDNPDLLERRQQCWQWKKQLLHLKKRSDQLTTTDLGMDMPDVLKATHDYLQQLSKLDDEDPIEVAPMLIQALEDAAKEAKGELEWIDSQINDLNSNITSQFNDREYQQIPYRLQSVFIHRGFHNSGHYWIYIYDFANKLWRKYNDGYVTEVKDVKEIFVQEPGERPATPYFLVYVKEDLIESLVDAVCRNPFADPPKETQDVEMEDYTQTAELATTANSYGTISNPQEYNYNQNHDWSALQVWNGREAPGHGW